MNMERIEKRGAGNSHCQMQSRHAQLQFVQMSEPLFQIEYSRRQSSTGSGSLLPHAAKLISARLSNGEFRVKTWIQNVLFLSSF